MTQSYKKLYEQEMKKFNIHWVMEVIKELQPKDLKVADLKDWKERVALIPVEEKYEMIHEHMETSSNYDYYSCDEDLNWFKLMFDNQQLPYMTKNQDGWFYSILKDLVFCDSDEPRILTERNRAVIEFFFEKTSWQEGEFEDFITPYCEKYHHQFGEENESIFPLLKKYGLIDKIPQEAMDTFVYDALTALFTDSQILNLALIDREITTHDLVEEDRNYRIETSKKIGKSKSDDFEDEHTLNLYNPVIDYINEALKNPSRFLKFISPYAYYSFDKFSVYSYLDVDKLSQVIQKGNVSEKDFMSNFLIQFLTLITSKEVEKAKIGEMIDFSSDFLKYYNTIAKKCGFNEVKLPQEYARTKFFEQATRLLEKIQLDISVEESNSSVRKIKI